MRFRLPALAGLMMGLLATILLGGGCVQRVENGSTGASGGTGKTELVLYTWTEVDEVNANQQLIAKFEQQHPDITVRLQNEPGSREAMAKLQTMFAGGTAPDVMSIHGAYYFPFAGKGTLADLAPYIQQDNSFDIKDFYPHLIDVCTYKGKLYSLPRYTSVYTIFYNKALFDAAGLPYPGAGKSWTWDDYLADAKALTKTVNGQKQWGCMIDFWGARLYPWLWSNNADLMNADRSKCVIDSAAAIEAISFLKDLRHKSAVCPESSAAERNQGLDSFIQGNVGMYITGPWDIQTLKKAQTLEWDIAPIPARKRRATMLGTENYAISATTKHPQEAWELFKFLMSPESQTVMAEQLEKMPSRKSVAEGPYLKQQATYNRKVFIDALQYAQMPPNIPEWDKIESILQEYYDQIWLGKATPDQGLKQAAAEINRTINKLRQGQ